MSRSKLTKAMAQGGGVASYINPDEHRTYTAEEMMEELFENRSERDVDGGTLTARANKRNTLMSKMGFDFVDARELIPNEGNVYSMDDGSVEALAKIIYETKHTDPIVCRAIPEGLQIVDGERRYRAHLKLGEQYGDMWYMIPVRRFEAGELSDDDAKFLLHAENIGQRAMTPSERAIGFAVIADKLIREKAKGEKKRTREVLAEQFGVSQATAQMNVNIGRNLTREGLDLYDEKGITVMGANELAKLEPEAQGELIEQIRTGAIEKSEVVEAAREARTGKKVRTRKPKTTDDKMREALKCLRAAVKIGETSTRAYIAEARDLLDELDPDKQ